MDVYQFLNGSWISESKDFALQYFEVSEKPPIIKIDSSRYEFEALGNPDDFVLDVRKNKVYHGKRIGFNKMELRYDGTTMVLTRKI